MTALDKQIATQRVDWLRKDLKEMLAAATNRTTAINIRCMLAHLMTLGTIVEVQKTEG